MQTLLLEPFGGLAGDMLLAGLLDLDQAAFQLRDLVALAERLVPGEARLSSEEVRRGAFRGRLLRVETPESAHAPHRHLGDLVCLLARANLSDGARARATAVLTRLAEAEAEVHGTSIEAVHFHEVGAVDTLIDVAGAVLALELLGVQRVLSRPPYVGGGTIEGAHGIMPVPAPGTAAILRGVPHELGVGGERLTPTGAALIAVLTDAFVDERGVVFEAQALGHGAGAREPAAGPANLLRVQLGESASEAAPRAIPAGARHSRVWLLEVNLDDTTPEEVGFLLGRLRAAGALEAWSQPLQMKKDRPGVLVSALTRAEAREALEAACFAHTATLGVRWSVRERVELAREIIEVDLGLVLGLQDARVRIVRRTSRPSAEHHAEASPDGSALDLSPEHDDLAALAIRTGRSLRELEGLAIERARACWIRS